MRRGLTDADRDAWAGYVRSILPLSGRVQPDSSPARPEEPLPQPSVTRVPSLRRAALPAVNIGTSPAGVDTGTWQRFRAGRLPVERTLDLHGHTAERAFHAVVGFLRAAHAGRLRCVEVITGRGNGEAGVIRREFPLWLNRPDIRPLVLAAAHPHAANPGSVRLLLRRIRP
jgi:DNA-nicking Smr family endonuclease